MKIFKSYLAFAMVLSLLFAGCSKDEADPSVVEPTNETAELSFGAILDNLANRGMTKDHFDQVPTCNDEAEPAVARVTISYGDVEITVDVDILSDDEGNYFTDYSDQLEIPVAVSDDDDESNDFTTVSLDSFMVYDGNPNDGGDLIWVAPTGDGDFTGYVNNPLPFDIIVRPGVKKYVEVEVLCFDRRMVNQYGYLFFDLIPEKVYPLCFFANYCDEDGRHYPGNYGVDLSVLVDTEGTRAQLYEAEDTMPDIGNYGSENEPEYYADPLCLVVPGPPEGVGDDEPYLFYTITPEDWEAAYGEDADNTPLAEVGLSWNEVSALLNDDGETNEYVHLFINCDEDEIPDPIDEDTNIYIYFDSSGSMNSTLNPLQVMRDDLLKATLLPLYNGDETLYDEKVRIVQDGSERTLNFLNFGGETPTGNVISLVFQDEAVNIYTSASASWDENTARTGQYDTDVSTFRGRLGGFASGQYRGVVFQVATEGNYQDFPNFKSLIQYVQNGTGNYAGSNGLSDKTEVDYVYDVKPGDTPSYYNNLILTTLQGLGYAL